MLLMQRTARRFAGGALVAIGASFMWLAPEDARAGVILLVCGIALEFLGVALEHWAGRSRPPEAG